MPVDAVKLLPQKAMNARSAFVDFAEQNAACDARRHPARARLPTVRTSRGRRLGYPGFQTVIRSSMG